MESGGGGYSGESETSLKTAFTSTNTFNSGDLIMGPTRDPMADTLKWVGIALAIAWALKRK